MKFLETISTDEARRILQQFGPISRTEVIGLKQAGDRVLAQDFYSPESLPSFARSLMDGYVVRAADTFSAGEFSPVSLELAGHIAMGDVPQQPLPEKSALAISTGGAIPSHGDAVVMLEHCREVTRGAGSDSGKTHVEINRVVGPAENILRIGEDIAQGDLLLPKGLRLRPQDLHALAALGIQQVEVFARPKILVVATGNELVSASMQPQARQIRDANSVTLAAQIARAGGEAIMAGIVPDNSRALAAVMEDALPQCDAVFVSGGSSKGVQDITSEVLSRFGPPGILAHGIAITPGKPTVLAAAGPKPLVGLPGHPVSSLLVTRLFLYSLVCALGGESKPGDPFPRRIMAKLSRSVPSHPGRESWIHVFIVDGLAKPILKGSGAITTALRADGVVKIPSDVEGLAAGQEVDVHLW